MTILGDYVTGLVDRELWQQQAICPQTDAESFFPEKGGSTREAKAVCASCPVIAECLAYALDHDIRFGVWGGMSENQRRQIRNGKSPTDDMPPIYVPTTDGHGRAMYEAGCRCEVCMAANAEYHRLYVAARRSFKPCQECGGDVRGRGRTRFCVECRPSQKVPA